MERLDCPTDRRGQIARLTDVGFAALDAAAPGHVEQVRRSLFDRLTPAQVVQLAAISAAIAAGEHGDGECCPSSCGGEPGELGELGELGEPRELGEPAR